MTAQRRNSTKAPRGEGEVAGSAPATSTLPERLAVPVASSEDDGARAMELAQTREMAIATQEVQAAIVAAARFPRSEDNAWAMLQRAVARPTMAERAEYRFPRGGKNVSGESIYLAREAARCWGNIWHGFRVISDSEDLRVIEAFAWDVQTGARCFQQDSFRKLIQRKGDGATKWVVPDERDLRELTNRRAAIAVRNAILGVLPKWFVEDAVLTARQTQEKGAKEDPEGQRRVLVKAFGDVGVTVENLETYLGHAVAASQPAEIVELRAAYAAVRDGETTWAELIETRLQERSTAKKREPEEAPVAGAVELPPRDSQQPAQQAPAAREPGGDDEGAPPEPEPAPQWMSQAKVSQLVNIAGDEGRFLRALRIVVGANADPDRVPVHREMDILRAIEALRR